MDMETKKLNNKVQNYLTTIDQRWLRPLQKDMFLCSARCCDDLSASTEGVNQCLKNCSNDFQDSYNYSLQQVEQFQARVSRCAQECYDQAREPLTEKSTQAEVDGALKKFEECSANCMRTLGETLPNIVKKIEDFVEKRTKEKNFN